jgi:hypothetical protein
MLGQVGVNDMMGFDDRSGKTQPIISALEQKTVQAIRGRKIVSGGLYPKTATDDQIVKAVVGKPRSL